MMRIDDKSDDEIRALVDAARDAGINFFDHADIYGGELHGCERRFAEALRLDPAERAEIVLQTKGGIVPDGPYFDFSYEHIDRGRSRARCAALDTDYIDILLLHRPDALVEPEEVARAFDELEAAGKVRAFGVSNHTPGQIELLHEVRAPAARGQPGAAVDHARADHRPGRRGEHARRSDQSIDRDDGILDYCRLHDITVQAWSPFQAGFFTGVFLGDRRLPGAQRGDRPAGGGVRRPADRDRDRLDHPAPRADAGGAGHDDTGAGDRLRRRARTSR